jgi:hypothetical protein
MPDPTLLLQTLHRAVEHFRATPGRRGRLVQLPEAAEVLVAGDLHGNVENFRLLLQKADLGRQPQRHLVLQEVIHGPHRYPTGGDKSHQLVDLLAALKCQHPQRVHFLLGNHELSQWTERRIAKDDLDLNDQFRAGVDTAYGEHGAAIYAAYLELFAVVPVALRTGNRIFLCHSTPYARRLEAFDLAALERDEIVESDILPGGAIHSLVWGRDTSGPTAAAFLAKVDCNLLITGHIPSENGYELPNDRQLILDSLGSPAAYCLFPTDRPLTQADLVAGVGFL